MAQHGWVKLERGGGARIGVAEGRRLASSRRWQPGDAEGSMKIDDLPLHHYLIQNLKPL
jgi:hypothetical protein